MQPRVAAGIWKGEYYIRKHNERRFNALFSRKQTKSLVMEDLYKTIYIPVMKENSSAIA